MMTVIATPPLHRWTCKEWDQMVESGCFEGKRVEFIDGEIVDMSPQCEPHVASVILACAEMRRVFDESRFCVRVQMPLRLGRNSDPEPDVAVVPGTARSYIKTGHPQTAIIVMEVSQDSLPYDRGVKASLYASAGIADYWVVNLAQRQCEVHRKPVRSAKERFGWRYSQIAILKSRDSIAPLAARDKPITVADLLP